MKRVDQVIAWLIVLLGLRSGLTALRVFAETVAPWPVAFYLLSTGWQSAARSTFFGYATRRLHPLSASLVP